MNFTQGDLCYWELFIDTDAFQAKHKYANGKLSEVYINLNFDNAPSNIQRLALQGVSHYNATTVTLNSSFSRFPLSNGSRVYLIAYPQTATVPPLSMLSFTYNLSTEYYPVKGLDA